MVAEEINPNRQKHLSFMTTLSPWVSVYRPPKEPKPNNHQVIAGQTIDSRSTKTDQTPTGEITSAEVTENTPIQITGSENTEAAPRETTAQGTNAVGAVADTSAGDAPALVILFPWLSASLSAQAKYINAYRSMYPSAEILLVSSSLKKVLWRPGRKTPDVEPAIPIIKAIASTASEKHGTVGKPQILVHAFSNAGSAMLARVREAYGDPFPPHITIFDSAPGLYSFRRCLNGATSGIPRWLWVAVWPGSALITVSYATLYAGRRDAFRYWFEMHNEVGGEVRRTYIYSEADEMIAMSHVERHAHEAEKKGYDVRLERFTGSSHVSHMRLDENRYWATVKDTWQGTKAISPKL